MLAPSCRYSLSKRNSSAFIRFWLIVLWYTLFLSKGGKTRNGRTYWCDSRICKKTCKNKMVIYETYLSMDAWTNGQFNIVGMAEKFWTRNNTYYVIQFNPSCFRKQQYKFTFYFVCMLPKPSKTFNKFFKKVSLWFTCFTLKSVNCFQTWGVNSHKKALLQNP